VIVIYYKQQFCIAYNHYSVGLYVLLITWFMPNIFRFIILSIFIIISFSEFRKMVAKIK